MITFLVVGHLHPNSLQAIPMYRKFGEVIISCDMKDRVDLLHHYRLGCSVHMIFNDISSLPVYTTDQRISDHFLKDKAYASLLPFIMQALPIVKTKYLIVLRSDEFYSEWSTFLSALRENPCSLITNNIGCRKACDFPYMLSNHVIGGNTVMLKNMYEKATRALESEEIYTETVAYGLGKELIDLNQLLCLSYLMSNDLPGPDSLTDIPSVMRKWFHVIPIEKMGAIAYNLSTIRTPKIVTIEKIRSTPTYMGHLELENKTMDDILNNDATITSTAFKNSIAAFKCIKGQDWYQVMEIYSSLIDIESIDLLKELANAAIQIEDEYAANVIWNRIVKLNPQYK